MIFTTAMLAITTILIAFVVHDAMSQPRIVLKGTKAAPNIEIGENLHFHAFISHVWSTGQAKTHAIVRKMQLLMPGMALWLDVDKLDNIGELEQYIAESAVFILYYSEGYFRSENCRREVFAAFESRKPAFVIYEGNVKVIEEMKNECEANCPENGTFPSSSDLINYLFVNGGPIRWFDAAVFSAASLNMTIHRLLSNLPYYKMEHHLLKEGLNVPNEISSVRVKHPVQILVCGQNDGARDVVEEARNLLPACGRALIHLKDAAEFFSYITMIDTMPSTRTVFFLYLNHYTFLFNEEIHNLIYSAVIDDRVDILLAHETDLNKGGCSFPELCKITPQSLLDPPCELYSNNLAVPLHDTEDFRTISLRVLLTKMVGDQKTGKSSASVPSISMRQSLSSISFRRNHSKYIYSFDR